jgi:hypothetical protein
LDLKSRFAALISFVVGRLWAHALRATANASDREMILHRFAECNEILRGWHFPLLLSHLLCSFAFVIATLRKQDFWQLAAPPAFSLNASRLLGRFLSTFAGQLIFDLMLVAWFFHWAGSAARQTHSCGRGNSSM